MSGSLLRLKIPENPVTLHKKAQEDYRRLAARYGAQAFELAMIECKNYIRYSLRKEIAPYHAKVLYLKNFSGNLTGKKIGLGLMLEPRRVTIMSINVEEL